MHLMGRNRIWFPTALAIMLIPGLCGCGQDGRGQTGDNPQDTTVSSTAPETPQSIDLANATCPVMGGPVAADLWFDWQGYRIHICCPACEGAFRDDPGRYVPALLEDESIDPSVLDGFRQVVGSQGIMVAPEGSTSPE
jgi:hypothetical protein